MRAALLHGLNGDRLDEADVRRGSEPLDTAVVADAMTRTVVTVKAGCPVHEAARLMLERRIGGLPVVEATRTMIGIVTARDLVARLERRGRPGWWASLLGAERLARQYQRSAGTTVGEVMSRPVVTVAPDTPIATAIARLDEHGIGRLPVVADGVLIGILSRLDLVRLVAAPPTPVAHRSDVEIATEMRVRLSQEPWASCSNSMIAARNGVLWIAGVVEGAAQKAAIETMARSIAGCRGVQNHLVNRRDLPARRL
jgi:CBS domain-containing protein